MSVILNLWWTNKLAIKSSTGTFIFPYANSSKDVEGRVKV